MENENKIKKIIKGSGNIFHYRVIQFLRDNDWSVLISPYYNDNITNKPREIDIIAEKAFDVNGFGLRDNWLGTINVKLFIECKYVNQPTIFWFDKKDQDKAIERIISDTGLRHAYHNVNIESHRFFQLKEVAKLFASGKENQENDFIYKAINQSLNAMIYNKNSPSIIPEDPSGKIKKVLKQINYPVIACNSFDNFYKVNAGDNEEAFNLVENNFNLEINYAYFDKNKNHKNDYFLIDIIDFNKFSNFLKNLEDTDINMLKKEVELNSIQKRSNAVKNSRQNSRHI